MAGGHRFHRDQDGHSISVQLNGARNAVEVLVDGKVVAYRNGLGKDTSVLTAELPGDPPQPFRILLAPVAGAHGAPSCVMESAGTRCLMPLVPLGRPHLGAQHGPSPTRLIRRRLRRLMRRRARHR
ncbi:hypothetical protein J7E88_11460 [Streptomyces sp. ISL-10]|uniref:hypothetical protein n=1 Tax=Streptomyces sp. ISL-10 TaxID=2819172 RepID=UPI001BE8A683|nr:hypothetical protein [Streptomyces sp. ISL-10]MBT2365906.1 hypothetical protein [Streptomyces sp. ISL-10]